MGPSVLWPLSLWWRVTPTLSSPPSQLSAAMLVMLFMLPLWPTMPSTLPQWLTMLSTTPQWLTMLFITPQWLTTLFTMLPPWSTMLPTTPLLTTPLPTTLWSTKDMSSPSTTVQFWMLFEIADVCTPALDTVCTPIELSRKSIKDVEQCYTVTRTVCTESTEEIDNEVCTYSYQPKTEATTAKTVEVSFNKECENMMVTVCQPNAGYGYHAYGHNYCKEVAQETCYNVPVLPVVEPAVDVIYPEPIKTCVNKS